MASKFDHDKYYDTGEWKIAASSGASHYDKLGFRSDDTLSDKQIIEAFLLRHDWWNEKDKIARSGRSPYIIKDVGPFIQDALKNLSEAKAILSDPVKKAQYDKKLKDEVARKAEEELIRYIHFCLPDGISPEEKCNLFNMADTLNIARTRAEEILLDEMNKAGAQFTSGSSDADSTESPKPLDNLLNKTWYEVLGVDEDADYAQIKAAYDKEHQKYLKANDKAKASARFYVVSEAWDCLKDPVKRREYDVKPPPPPDPPGDPRLVVVRNTDYTFRDIRRGIVIEVDKIIIKNPDGGMLHGTIKSDVPWLEPDRNKILEQHEQELYVNILTSKIPPNTYDTTGNITLDTNGGAPYSIPFRVIMEGLEIATDRFRKTYVPLIAACAGFIGSFGASPFSNFLIGAFVLGIITFALAKLFVKFFLNEGIDLFKIPPVLIQSAAAGVVILTIMAHSGGGSSIGNKASSDPASAPASVPSPAPASPSINITKAVVAAGADANDVAFGIDTSFSPGNKTLHYNITYDGAIANQTVFFFKWFKSGNLISESQFTLQHPSGWVDDKLSYDFQPGDYSVEAYVAGKLVNTSSFIIVETPASAPAGIPATVPDTPSIKITKAVVAAGVDTNNVPFGIDTSFSPGNKTLHYNITYDGAIANQTVVYFKWFKSGTLINEYQFTLQHPSGWVDDKLSYDFQPGQYEVQLHVNGKQLDSTSFNVIFYEQRLPQQKKVKKVMRQQRQYEVDPSGI